jgi:F-type H+-transporting ATPase subunit epsilon
MKTINLQIVTIERKVYEDKIDSVVLPTLWGEIGILPGHIPLITSLSEGELRIRKNNQVNFLACSGGFVKVDPDKVLVLADVAEHAEEIDIKRAEEAKEKASETMKKAKEKPEYAVAAAALRRSIIRLKVARKKRKTKHISHPETGI